MEMDAVLQAEDAKDWAYKGEGAGNLILSYIGSSPSMVRIGISRDFLELVEKNVLNSRPTWRLNASSIDSTANVALLIADHSLFSGNPKDSSCIAVEIKAKCGFLPSSEYISKANSIKKQVTRYKMHQHLKFHQGEISKTSECNPLDLFSGSKERICMAIKALFSTPQNNFRIFADGSLVFGGTGGGVDNVHPDERDVSRRSDQELLRKYALLHCLSLDKSLRIVWDFLISATVKDCSLMISFSPRESVTADSEYDSIFLESVKQNYDYKAYLIDLDVKPMDKMEHYFKLDQKIVNFYTRNAEVRQSAKGSGAVTKR